MSESGRIRSRSRWGPASAAAAHTFGLRALVFLVALPLWILGWVGLYELVTPCGDGEVAVIGLDVILSVPFGSLLMMWVLA
jgi:hypothetical protein